MFRLQSNSFCGATLFLQDHSRQTLHHSLRDTASQT
nr:MAG TPA_asm: hypothetical protein [Caudoviricetes sp.]